MTDHWHRPLRHVKGGELSGNTAQTSGMRRLEAVSGRTVGSEKVWMGETHIGPATNSGDHHHGEAETAIYVKSGHPVFVFAEGDEEIRLEAGRRTSRTGRRTRAARTRSSSSRAAARRASW
jgi:uncharacterized RmlC-like cupin family protein